MMKTGRRNLRNWVSGPAARRGFAFTEVLFAVMVLGIGFIMIAAMFPITIRQTQMTLADTNGAGRGKAALAFLQSIATDANFPVTVPPTGGAGSPPDPSKPAQVVSLQQVMYNPDPVNPFPGFRAARGNYIDSSNPRFAWVPLYRRGLEPDGTPSPYAQVFIIAVQNRRGEAFKADRVVIPGTSTVPPTLWNDLWQVDGTPPGTWASLEPRRVQVKVAYDPADGRGKIQFLNLPPPHVPASGAYVVIAHDPNLPAPSSPNGQSNGRIYQLGNAIDEANQIWELAPGADMVRKGGATPVAGDDNDLTAPLPNATEAYIIGRGYTEPWNPAAGYSGTAQDIAIYTGFIGIAPK